MSMSAADYLIDRRRLKSQASFWRIATFVVAALAVIALGVRFSGLSGLGGKHISRIAISGLITGDEETLKLIRRVAKSNAEAVVLDINSPGGTTAGSEALYEELRRLAKKKPVVSVVGNLAASGAYIAALGSDHIFVRGNSLVGSIGVLVQFPNVAGLMDKVGVKLESIKSSPLKAAPNGFEPTSDAARQAMADIVTDSFDWFKGLVRDRRGMNDEELAKVDDGRVFTGRQGIGLKLADAIGGEQEAIAWLEKEKGIEKDLPVREERPDGGFAAWKLTSLTESLARSLGLTVVAEAMGLAGGNTSVDGLTSVWQTSFGK